MLPAHRNPDRREAGFSLVELMAFMALLVVMAAFVLPFTRSTLTAMNLGSDARNILSSASLAKMRAAANFTQARLYVDLNARTFRVDRWNKAGAGAWVPDGVSTPLKSTVNFGFLGLSTPPPNTQPAIGQAPTCLDNAGVAIANTACIVFNSRGVPVDALNTPTATGAVYVNDGSSVFGITASTGGHIRLWRSNVVGGAQWVMN
jgi:type II secretory pathway pseudopilin PulG